MLTRRSLLAASAAAPLVFSFPAWAEDAAAAPLTFGVITDLHQDVIPDAPARLAKFVAAMTEAKVGFICQMGDFCVPKEANRVVLTEWEKFDGDRYHVLGNHDMDGNVPREQAVKFLGMPSRYYAFDQQGVRFLVLDGNDPGGKASGYKRYIAADQQAWLKQELSASTKPVVIFVHQSLENAGGIENGGDVLKLLAAANQERRKVLAVFCGHHHQDYVREVDGIPHVQINSASYYWVGEKLAHNSYDAATHKKYKSLSSTCPYRDPLWATVTIDLKAGKLSIVGRTTEWVGDDPWKVGATEQSHDRNIIRPGISPRTLAWNA